MSAVFGSDGETEVFRGRFISVVRRRVTGPDGPFERDVVHHPGAVGVVPLHDDGTVTMVRQYRAALDRELWEIPAGLRDVDGEAPERTAARELAEEVGLTASTLAPLCVFHNSPGFTDEEVHLFVATGLAPVPHDRQGVEEHHMVVDRLPLADALAMVDAGDITDAKTVIALALVRLRRGDGSG